MCKDLSPVSHCKDTYYFDKINNFFKEYEEKGGQVYGLPLSETYRVTLQIPIPNILNLCP